MNIRQALKVIFLTILAIFPLSIIAANLHISVVDEQLNPVENAVVYINETSQKLHYHQLVIDQVDKEFIPYVTVIQRGSSINFPNNDDIRHQVYSFSKPKQFELPLYSGNALRPVVFDQKGVVAMACNIHDWMKAYVYIVDTNKFTLTDKSGTGTIQNLPEGQYEVLIWHPTLKASTQLTAKNITIKNEAHQLSFTVSKKSQLKAWRAPKGSKRRGY